MIIALFALAVLMIVGGVASVVQGFPFVRLESGMAMTVAGATTASAGAVVLGLATVAGHLRGLGRRLRELRPKTSSVEVRPAELLPPRPPEPDLFEPAFPVPAPGDRPLRQRPSLGGSEARDVGLGALGAAAGLGAAGIAGAEFGAGRHGRGTEPTFVLPPDPDLPAPPPPEATEPLLPDLLPPADEIVPTAEARREPEPEPELAELEAEPELAELELANPEQAKPAPVEPDSAEAGTVVHGDHRTLPLFDPGPDASVDPVRLYPTLDTMADIAPEPVPAPTPPVAEDKPEVVGTYTSGGNTYVMFANGSIEAETPRGRFSFSSLDELKDFVEAGGETDARGAA